MGWIRGLAAAKLATCTSLTPAQTRNQTKDSFEHIENISGARDDLACDQLHKPDSGVLYPFQPSNVSDEDLPFIPAEVLRSKRRPGALCGKESVSEEPKDYWVVVDAIVYDCTSFISSHPGGEQVILSFVGENCSCMSLYQCIFAGICLLTFAIQGSSGDFMGRRRWNSMEEICELEGQEESKIDS